PAEQLGAFADLDEYALLHQAAGWARGEHLSTAPAPGDGSVTREIADGWRAILLRRPRWRGELELRAESATGEWPAAMLAELGQAEPDRVQIDLTGVDARPGAAKPPTLAIERRDGTEGPTLADALSRLPAWLLIGRRFRRVG
ncbi:MAG: hypothetical protein ABIR11_14140, partial [Candidatus Limnocylindrales bacterium]